MAGKVTAAALPVSSSLKTTTTTTLDDEVGEGERGKAGNSKAGGLLVIGAGYGRTGTSSLQEALSILGYGPVYHMREVFRNDGHVHKWNNKVVKFKLENNNNGDKDVLIPKETWDDIFRGYNSTMDFPAVTYWEDLYKVYPTAKIILSIRDDEYKWYQSVLQTIAPPNLLWRILYKLTGLYDYDFSYMTYHTVWKAIYDSSGCSGGDEDDNSTNDNTTTFNIDMVRTHPEVMMKGYKNHNQNVISKVPSHNLLVFNVKDGWKPLCDFLNCDIPKKKAQGEDNKETMVEMVEMEFPHINDSKQFDIMVQKKRTKCLTRLFVGMGVVVLATAVVAVTRNNKRK